MLPLKEAPASVDADLRVEAILERVQAVTVISFRYKTHFIWLSFPCTAFNGFLLG